MRRMFVTLLVLLWLGIPAQAQPADQTITGTVTSTTCPGTGCVRLSTAGLSSVSIEVTGTWVGTLQFEAVVGTTWIPVDGWVRVTGTNVTSTTANGTWTFRSGSMAAFRVRASAYTSGTATVVIRGSAGISVAQVNVGPGGGGGGGDASAANQVIGNTSLASLDTKLLPTTVTATGTVTAVNSTTTLTVTGYAEVTGVLLTDPTSQSFAVEATNNGTDWVGLQPQVFGLGATGNPLPSATSGFSTNGAPAQVHFRVSVTGFDTFRVRKIGGTVASTWAMTAATMPYVSTVQSAMLFGGNGYRINASNTTGSMLVEPGSQWNTTLVDGSGSPAVTVKAASTAAVAADPALVVRSVQLPAALGQTTMAASSPVVIASDQSDVKTANGVVAQVTGTLLTDTVNSAVTITGLANYGSVFARYVGGGGLGGPVGIAREATLDGTNWFAVGSYQVQGTQNGATVFGARSGASSLYTTTDSWYEVIPVGFGITGVRYRVSAGIAAGSTATVRLAANAATLPLAVNANVVGTALVAATQAGAGTNLGAWWTRIGDTTNGPVAVKAASTAAAAADPALVIRSIQLPAAVGQTTMAAGLPVTLASDQSALPVSGTLAVTSAGLTNLDVALSTRTKPADQQHAIIDSGTTTVTQATGSNLHVVVDTAPTTAVTGPLTDTQIRATPLPVTGPLTDTQIRATPLPVSGTVTANAGTNLNTSALALDATLTGRTQKSQITDGTRDGTVKAASTLPALTDTAVVTTQRDPLPAGTNVIGHVIADTGSTTAVTGNVTVTQATGTNLHTVLDTTSTTAVTQATGTNLHAVIDTGSTTAATQATAANLNATVTQGPANATPWNDNIAQIGGSTVATAGTGIQKVGLVGNAGAAVDAANNAAAPANVVVQGVETIGPGSQPTAATTGNVRRLLGSTEGVVFVQEGNSNRFSCLIQAATVTTQCQAAPGAGLRAYVTSVHLSNQAATVQTLDVVFGTGAACVTGTTALTHKWQMGTAATTTSPQSIDAGFQTPLVPTAANAICVRPSAATAFGVTITGYIAP